MRKISQEEKERNLAELKKRVDVELIYCFCNLYKYNVVDFAAEMQVSRTYLSSILNGLYPCSEAICNKINSTFNKICKEMVNNSDNPNVKNANRFIRYISGLNITLNDGTYFDFQNEITNQFKSHLRNQSLGEIEKNKKQCKLKISEIIDQFFQPTIDKIADFDKKEDDSLSQF